MGTRFAFGILGPLEVRRDGLSVAVGGPRQRALLAMLLCNANQVVSRDRLTDELLGDQPPSAAERTLRVQVSRLRRALAAPGDEQRVLARAPGYLLRVEPGELDLHAFERLVGEGRLALDDDDPKRAARALREAEALWRGRPFADLEFEPFVRVEVERLEETRLCAVEDRIDAELTLGRHETLVAELDALASVHPLRERLRGQLMLALYRSGRHAEALAAYREGRALLVEQLGLEPSPRLRELERAILRHDDVLQPASTRDAALATLAPPRAAASVAPAAAHIGAPPAGPRVGRRWRVGGVAVTVAAVVGAVAALSGNGMRPGEPPRGNALSMLSADGRLTGSVALASAPTRVAAGFGSLWVTHFDADRVSRVDAGDDAVRDAFRVGNGPSGIAVGAGAVWVANSLEGTVSRIDPSTAEVVQRIAVGSRPSDIATADDAVWVANADAASVSRVDARSGRVVRTIDVGTSPTALAVDGGTLWVASEPGRSVVRIDARTNAVEASIAVGGGPAALLATASGVWVANSLDGTVSRIDPRRNTVAATIRVGDGPQALTATGEVVWVANEFGGTLSVIDARLERVTAMRATHAEPTALTASEGRLWVATRERGPSHRGGALVLVNADRSFGRLEPALAGGLYPPVLFGMTNDGLVSFKHVGGSDGTQLVPDLAISLPTPTDGARTYTFRLRLGLRYSTGEPVRARDVRYSLERMFRLRSPGATYYEAIVGARRCIARPRRCDLSRGVLADDRHRVVTIRLREPDPELPYKLALPYALVIPTGDRASTGHPLPATGPYRIATYRPGRDLTLVRNPRFREWSRTAQPDGYPDRITWKFNVAPGAAVAAILRGRADWMLGIGQLPRRTLNSLRTRNAGLVHVHRALATDYLSLNVHVPPFDDVRARRAINYAIDRRAVARLYGGPSLARPTCQILPPQMPGFRRYCPYAMHSDATGVWHGPDLARARHLVAQSHTRGARVVVLDSTTPVVARGEGRLTVQALRSIGYRARLKLLPNDVYVAVAGNQNKARSNVQSGGWGADYPAASDFVHIKLSCTSYQPGVDGNANAGGFCSPRLDRMTRRARQLQVANPARANALWARIDHKLVDRAVWLPLVTPPEIDLVSARVHNYQYHPLWGLLLDQLWLR